MLRCNDLESFLYAKKENKYETEKPVACYFYRKTKAEMTLTGSGRA